MQPHPSLMLCADTVPSVGQPPNSTCASQGPTACRPLHEYAPWVRSRVALSAAATDEGYNASFLRPEHLTTGCPVRSTLRITVQSQAFAGGSSSSRSRPLQPEKRSRPRCLPKSRPTARLSTEFAGRTRNKPRHVVARGHHPIAPIPAILSPFAASIREVPSTLPLRCPYNTALCKNWPRCSPLLPIFPLTAGSSFQIEESKGKDGIDLARATDAAAKGWSRLCRCPCSRSMEPCFIRPYSSLLPVSLSLPRSLACSLAFPLVSGTEMIARQSSVTSNGIPFRPLMWYRDSSVRPQWAFPKPRSSADSKNTAEMRLRRPRRTTSSPHWDTSSEVLVESSSLAASWSLSAGSPLAGLLTWPTW